MNSNKRLWLLSFTCPVAYLDVFADGISENAISLSFLTPPRKMTASLEAIFDTKPNGRSLAAKLAILALMNQTKAPTLTIKRMPNLNWLKKVSSDFPPHKVASWTIFGAAHKQSITRPRSALQIDATSAFGTGEHPTTKGCLIMLEHIMKNKRLGHSMLDVGCGTGILAMAYVQKKRGQAVAVDLDKQSVAIAKGNVRSNGLQRNIRLQEGNGYRLPLVKNSAPYDLIMANILAQPLTKLAKDLSRHLKPGGQAILAGLLTSQAARVIAAHSCHKVFLTKRIKIGEWTILAMKRPLKA